MSFDITGLNKDEQELGLGIHSRIAYPLGSSWSLDVSARYTVMYTHERIRLFDLAAGVSRSFGMPGWLKDFLK